MSGAARYQESPLVRRINVMALLFTFVGLGLLIAAGLFPPSEFHNPDCPCSDENYYWNLLFGGMDVWIFGTILIIVGGCTFLLSLDRQRREHSP